MFKISKRNCIELYNQILCREEIDSSLNDYKDILEIIFEKTNYTPFIQDVLICLFIINQDKSLLINNLEYLKYIEKFQEIINTRKNGFDLQNPIIYKLIRFYKESDIYNSNHIIFLDKILYGLSVDYKKIDENIEQCSSRLIIDLLIKMILTDKENIHFFEPDSPIENFYYINKEMSLVIYNIYNCIILLKERYQIYIKTLGRVATPLSEKIVYWSFCIDYFLNLKEKNYFILNKILNNSIYDDEMTNCLDVLFQKDSRTNYFKNLFSYYGTTDLETIECKKLIKDHDN